MKADDEIDQYFEEVRDEMIDFIKEEKGENGKRIFDLIMVTKYLERIGDHATNIAEWVEFSITGVHQRQRDHTRELVCGGLLQSSRPDKADKDLLNIRYTKKEN